VNHTFQLGRGGGIKPVEAKVSKTEAISIKDQLEVIKDKVYDSLFDSL
jgi:hypothetical protein